MGMRALLRLLGRAKRRGPVRAMAEITVRMKHLRCEPHLRGLVGILLRKSHLECVNATCTQEDGLRMRASAGPVIQPRASFCMRVNESERENEYERGTTARTFPGSVRRAEDSSRPDKQILVANWGGATPLQRTPAQ